MLLALPRLSPLIPRQITFGGASAKLLKLALSMCTAGIVDKREVAAFESPLTVSQVQQAVMAGMERMVANRLDFKVLSMHTALALSSNNEGYAYGDSLGQIQVEIAFNAGKADEVMVGAICTELEKHRPGLGRYALSILDKALCGFGMPMTPFGALAMAQYTYWWGEEDEQMVIDDMAEQGEENAFDVPRRDDLFDGIPRWAYDFSCQEQPQLSSVDAHQQCQAIDNEKLKAFLASIAQLDLLLTSARGALPDQPEDEPDSCEFPVLLRWSENDYLMRILDDYWQHQQQGELYYCMGHIRFDHTSKDVKTAISRLDKTLDVYAALDRSLYLIQEYNSHA